MDGDETYRLEMCYFSAIKKTGKMIISKKIKFKGYVIKFFF